MVSHTNNYFFRAVLVRYRALEALYLLAHVLTSKTFEEIAGLNSVKLDTQCDNHYYPEFKKII